MSTLLKQDPASLTTASVDSPLSLSQMQTPRDDPVGGIERRARLSRREFEHEYSLPRRPVILTDATASWAARRWNLASLRERAGHREIEYRGALAKVRFGDLIDAIESSDPKSPAPYGRNIHVFRDLPELADDIRPRLADCQPDWKSTRLLPKHFGFENGLEEMFIGGRGAKFPGLHVDYWGMDAFISQLHGEKEVLVCAPDQTPFLHTDPDDPLSCPIDDFDHPDLERFPLFAQAQPIRFTLQPGETLFCPNGWWHTTAMPGVSITVVTAQWCRGNWRQLIEDYVRTNRATRRVKTALVANYLRAVGVALTLRDRLWLGL